MAWFYEQQTPLLDHEVIQQYFEALKKIKNQDMKWLGFTSNNPHIWITK